VSERSRFSAAPYLATCLLRDSEPPNGEVGSLYETTPGVQNPGVEAGFSDTLWSLRTIPIRPPRPEI